MMYIFFIFGLFLGSLLNNIALRIEKNEDFIWSRSKCPFCQKKLKWYELIPILSFVFQKGKCRYCQNKISLRYPLVEIFTAFWVFLLAFSLRTSFNYFSLLEFSFYLIFFSILFVLALYDFKTFLVDDRLIVGGIVLGFLFHLVKKIFLIPNRDFSYLLNYFFYFGKLEFLFSPFFLSLILFFIFLITKGKGIGFGDVKIAFLLGLFFKPGDGILVIILSSLLGSIYGIYLFLKNKKIKIAIPFVPFLFLGSLLTVVLGKYLTTLYFNFML